jgi:hypothetical protein
MLAAQASCWAISRHAGSFLQPSGEFLSDVRARSCMRAGCRRIRYKLYDTPHQRIALVPETT